jgi:hypothetical protein
VDGAAVLGTARACAFSGERLAMVQTGMIRQYLFFSVLTLAVAGGIYLVLV